MWSYGVDWAVSGDLQAKPYFEASGTARASTEYLIPEGLIPKAVLRVVIHAGPALYWHYYKFFFNSE
jgi:hypothetical protein